MARVGVVWKAAILDGRRSRFWARGLWVRAARDERLCEVVLFNEAAAKLCRSSVVRATDAISAIEALSRIAEWDAVGLNCVWKRCDDRIQCRGWEKSEMISARSRT